MQITEKIILFQYHYKNVEPFSFLVLFLEALIGSIEYLYAYIYIHTHPYIHVYTHIHTYIYIYMACSLEISSHKASSLSEGLHWNSTL